MSDMELRRAGVLARVQADEITLRHASVLLQVSYRQAKRLWARFRRRGPMGVQHRHVGRRSNRRKPSAFRRKVLALIRREFAGDATHARFGPTLAAEHLAEEYGLVVHHETLRRWMQAAGLWSRTRRGSPHRSRRERMAHFGELVQFDGSFAHWLEERAGEGCLMHLVDDATSRCDGRFEPQETIWGAVRSLRRWIAQYGIPVALYTDWKNVYVRKPTAAELGTGEAVLTQFGRMCARLGIRIIAASSPQAKGRVERGHGTHQDRLIKKLRRAGVGDYAAANAYLATTYWAGHNARFARAPAAAEDFHTPVPSGLELDQVFRLESVRTISPDWVVRVDNQLLQIHRQGRHYPPARSTVLVCDYEDGHRELWYRGAQVSWTDVTGRHARLTPPPPAPAPSLPPHRPRGRTTPSATHPWRQRYGGMPDGVSPGENIPGRPGDWIVSPAASAGPAPRVGGPLSGLVAERE